MACGARASGDAKKKWRQLAEASFWYGFDLAELPTGRRFAYLENLQSMLAQWKIAAGQFDATDYEAVYALFLLAYNDERIALEAEIQAARRFMETNCVRAIQR